jgi:nucleotide-binding universal stress UspA family protein
MTEDFAACPLTRGRRILVAVDGSPHAEHAVDQAISLGGICNSQIYALSVAEVIPEYLAEAPQLFERKEQEAREIAVKACDKIKNAGLECEVLTHFNEQPAEVILKEAKDKEIDLIVMGTRGRSLLARLLLGSVAQRVIAHAPCPVMVIPG